MSRRLLRYLTAALLLIASVATRADEVHAAVAANFTAAIKQLAPLFEQRSGHKLVASFGATGQLYAQISNGAPFDLLLSADDTTPKKLIDDGRADADSYFIYARGRLALWSSEAGFVDDTGKVLAAGHFDRIAIANPALAPYGVAAVETLRALHLYEQLQPKFVTGENIAQTWQFVASGNARLGFVALAQVLALPSERRGSVWIVPATLHAPIAQQAVLLKHGEHNRAARDFLAFLTTPAAVAVMRELGYAPGL